MGDPLDSKRWGLAILMSVIGVSLAVWAAWRHAGWPMAAISTGVEITLVAGYLLWTRDAFMARLLVFGLIVGLGELPSDAFSVAQKQTLVYPPGPVIWASPSYMPLSWAAVMVQMGFLSEWLTRRMRMGAAVAIMAVLGVAYVPLFEHLAHAAGFWRYQDCAMLAGTIPHYVMAAEAAILGALPLLLKGIQPQPWSRWILVALVESGIIYLATRLAFAVLA